MASWKSYNRVKRENLKPSVPPEQQESDAHLRGLA